MLDRSDGKVEVADRGAPSSGRREVLSTLALGGAYIAPMVLASMTPTKAAAASADGVPNNSVLPSSF